MEASAHLPRPASAISLVFIESNLWARLEPAARGFELTIHTPGAHDMVVVTTEGSLAAVLNGSLSASAAFDRGQIAIDGEAPARDAIARLLMAALDSTVASGSSTDGAQSADAILRPPALIASRSAADMERRKFRARRKRGRRRPISTMKMRETANVPSPDAFAGHFCRTTWPNYLAELVGRIIWP
jgi:hypothetical protein